MSNNKKNGVKRPGRAGKRPYENMPQKIQRQFDNECLQAYYEGQIQEQDIMLISLKQLGVLGKKRIPKLHKLIMENRRRFAQLAVEDKKGDKQLWYTKDAFDRELKNALGDHFMPWDARHDLRFHSDGIRSVEMRQSYAAFAAKVAEELEKELEK